MTQRALLQTWVCLLFLVCITGPVAVRAQAEIPSSVEASRDHFNRGVEYVQDGDLKGALIEFKRAYAIAPNYRVLYNLGQVENELRDYTEAQAYFQRYLDAGGDEIPQARRREVEALVAKLAGRIATLTVETNVPGAEVFVDGVSVGRSPLSAPIRVSTGTRVLSAVAPGRPRATQVVEAAGGETVSVRLRLAAAEQSAHAPLRAAAPQPTEAKSSAGVHPAVWLGIGSGALAVGAGVMAYLAERDASKYDDAVHRRTSARELDDLDSRARAKALVTDILLGATLVGTVVTVIVATSSGKSDSQEHAELRVGPGNVTLRGSF